MTVIREIENLKKAILEDYDRLTINHTFKFACHPQIPCFNQCCSDVNIFLTPYDILRLKKRLNIQSQEFLAQYTLNPIDKSQKFPVILLKMRDDEHKSCPFVSPTGCSVYQDRPWSCRMYPVGVAEPQTEDDSSRKGFYFMMRESGCLGFQQDKSWTIGEWMIDQEVEKYQKFGDLFKEITLHPYFQRGYALNPAKMEMFYLVCYDLDQFRRFVFDSTLLQRFVMAEEIVAKMKDDDEELLTFGFQWLKFSLFGEPGMEMKPEAREQVLKSKN
jgi:Fe-S-cluster containining protein